MMEQINVKKLVLGEVGTSEKIKFEDDSSNVEISDKIKAGKLQGEGKVIRLEETIFFSANLRCMVELECDRCLETFEDEIEFSLEREYEIDRQSSSEDNLYVDKYFGIDVTDPIREDLILAIPYQTICKEDCKGLCQKCGGNLNTEKCNCK